MSVATAARRVVPSGIDPRIWARRVAVARDRGRRWRSRAVAVAALLVGGLLLVHSGPFEARHRTVLGATHTTPAAVLAAAGITSSTPLVDISPAAAAARIDRMPWVLRASVRRSWPDGVVVTVVERTAVAVVDGPAGPALVGRAGRVLAVGTAAQASQLPVIRAPGPIGAPGSSLAPDARPALTVSAALPGSLAGRVQQIAADSSGQVTLTLDGGVTVDFGPAVEVAAKFESLVAVLADPTAAPTGSAVIDVRAPGEPTVGPPAAG